MVDAVTAAKRRVSAAVARGRAWITFTGGLAIDVKSL